jgi:alpha-L-rhamnosidase
MYGRISSSWERAGTITEYKFTIPANTSATVYLPAPSQKSITEGGNKLKKAKGVEILNVDNGIVTMELPSGSYEFRVEL